MVGAKTEVATPINEIESHAHVTHYHGNAFETIKAIKIIRDTLDAAFELITLQILSKKARSFKYVERRQSTRKLVTENCAQIVERSEGHCYKAF